MLPSPSGQGGFWCLGGGKGQEGRKHVKEPETAGTQGEGRWEASITGGKEASFSLYNLEYYLECLYFCFPPCALT